MKTLIFKSCEQKFYTHEIVRASRVAEKTKTGDRLLLLNASPLVRRKLAPW